MNYSARVLRQELRQRGFAGYYETVKLAVRPLRADATVAALTQRRFEMGLSTATRTMYWQVAGSTIFSLMTA